MRRYTKYKSSGLSWLAEVPSDWVVSSIRYNALVIGRIGYRGYTVDDIVSEGEGAISLSPSNIQNQKFDLNKRTYISFEKYEESPEIKVYEGDVLLVKTASVGKVAFVDNLQGEKATINPQLVVFKNIIINSRFFYYYLISNDFQYQIDRDNYGGVVGTLTQASINSYRILVPSDKEQNQIARFLDHQTGVIDDLIKQKEKLIELLKEKRQAIINEAVTKGLDPKAKMKDSGIEWLGEIPKNWYVTRFNRGIELLTDYEANGSFDSIKKNVEFTDEEGFAWYVRATDLENNNVADVDKVRWVNEATYNFLSKTKLIGKELLIAKRGEIGKVYLMPETKYTATLAPNLYLVRLNERLNPNFTWFYFESYLGKNQLVLKNRSVTIGAIYKDDLKEIDMIFPPIEEQLQIVKYLNNACKDIEVISTSILTQIEKLKEYRQSLISEAVTGKIDVRDWQPKKQAVA